MVVQILAEQPLVEGAPGRLFHAGMGVGVDQAGQQPALAHQFGLPDRFVRPPVAIGVQVNGLSVRQCVSSNPQDGHADPAYKDGHRPRSIRGPFPGAKMAGWT